MLQVKVRDDVFRFPESTIVVIGRDPGAALRLNDRRISRQHAECRFSDGHWVFHDLKSSNGTFQDGQPVTSLIIDRPLALQLGDQTSGVPLELIPEPSEHSTDGRQAPVEDSASPVSVGARHAVPQPADAAPPTGAPLLADAPGNRTAIHQWTQQRVRIGRVADNDIAIDDLLVSRHHAELERTPDGGFALIDLNSANGTFVNGQRITRAPVSEADYITIGRHLFRLAGGTLEEYVDEGRIRLDAAELTVRTASGRVLLDGVSFSLSECSLLAIVGPSGAGKSTLLNALTGFRPAQSGSVYYAGRDLYTAYDELRNRIGYVPQDDILHRQLNVRSALAYAAELRFPPDVPAADRKRRVDEVLEELGLTAQAGLPVSNLSGGQRKRASVALELLTKPSPLVLDEPTSGLDPGFERTIMRLLRTLADGGRTIILTTHSSQSLTLCDRVLVLAPGGKLSYFGPPQEALGFFGKPDYADVFTALEQDRQTDWQARFRSHSAYGKYVGQVLERPASPSQQVRSDSLPAAPGRGFFADLSPLIRRYLAVLINDRRNLATLVLQAPILGVLILAIAPAGSFNPDSGAHTGARMVVAMVVIAATLMGATNAIREIVKELPIYRRERAAGLSVVAYLASRFIVLAALTLLQAIVFVPIAVLRQNGPPDSASGISPMLELIVDIGLTGIAAMTMALLVSALVETSDKAMTLLPLLLVPQIVLSGGLISLQDKPVISQLSYVMSANWGLTAVASTVDLAQLTQVRGAVGAQGLAPLRAAGTAADARWTHAVGTWSGDVSALLALTVIMLVATWVALRHRDPL